MKLFEAIKEFKEMKERCRVSKYYYELARDKEEHHKCEMLKQAGIKEQKLKEYRKISREMDSFEKNVLAPLLNKKDSR